jgi:O-antigen ligase
VSTIARDPIKPAMMVGGLAYVMMLAVALIWLHYSPLIILALTASGAALVTCVLRPILAVHTMIIIAQFATFLDDHPAGSLVNKSLGGVIVMAWALSFAADRKVRFRWDALYLAMGAFLLWCGLLFFTAIDAGMATQRTLTFCQLALAAVIFSSVVDTPPRLKGVLWAVLAWTTLSAAIGIGEYALGLRDTAGGLAGNRNSLALFINIAIVCGFLLHQRTLKPFAKLIIWISMPILFLGLALTLSRKGLIVFGVTMLFLFFQAARERRFILPALSMILILLLMLILPYAFYERAGSIVDVIQKQEDTWGLRISLWKVGLRMIADHPVRGVGPGNFIIAFPRYARGVMVTQQLAPHSSYISVASETGLVGLGLFLLIHVIALRHAQSSRAAARTTANRELDHLALAVQTVILVALLTGVSAHLEYTKYVWIFFGLAIAVRRMGEEELRRVTNATVATGARAALPDAPANPLGEPGRQR